MASEEGTETKDGEATQLEVQDNSELLVASTDPYINGAVEDSSDVKEEESTQLEKEEESTQLEVETKTSCADSVESSNKVEPSKEELPQKERISSSSSSSTLPPPPPRPQQEADGAKSGEMSAMPLPPPPPGPTQRPPGVPQPPRPPGIETMPWVPLPPSGRTQPLPPPGSAQFSGLLPGAFGNGILANGLSVATGGGPEVLEVWRDYFKLYREYVGKLVSEADHANPLFTASALGGVRSEKVCVHHLTGNCRRGFRCIDRHPVEANFKVHVRDFKRKLCRYADQCRTPKCLYYHPHEGDSWKVTPSETDNASH